MHLMPYYAETGHSRPPNRLTLRITLITHKIFITYHKLLFHDDTIICDNFSLICTNFTIDNEHVPSYIVNEHIPRYRQWTMNIYQAIEGMVSWAW
jgi:hypothetical protein